MFETGNKRTGLQSIPPLSPALIPGQNCGTGNAAWIEQGKSGGIPAMMKPDAKVTTTSVDLQIASYYYNMAVLLFLETDRRGKSHRNPVIPYRACVAERGRC